MNRKIIFYGLIDGSAEIAELDLGAGRAKGRLLLMSRDDYSDVEPGDSIAVNGICLSLLSQAAKMLEFEIWPATRAKTAVSSWKIGDIVNLERNKARSKL